MVYMKNQKSSVVIVVIIIIIIILIIPLPDVTNGIMYTLPA
jgi:accessory gene regulator protein AgrB